MSEPERKDERRILVGVDGSNPSRSALGWAIGQAALTGAVVEAAIAWHYPTAYRYPLPLAPEDPPREPATRVLDTAVYDVRQHVGEQVEIRPTETQGHAAQVLLDAAAEADMLVVGNRGDGGFAEALLGSTSQHCVHNGTCPVVIIRA